MRTFLDKNWKLKDLVSSEVVDANVPGDITIDLYHAGKIENPYFGLNHKKYGWIAERDFEYKCVFDYKGTLSEDEKLYLVFKGIDLFSEIYLNGVLLGTTENMFLEYKFDVASAVLQGENVLTVKMISTKAEMDKIDCTGYFGVFNVPRLFIRKAQCHFGWDWAPDLCGYGIWGDVYLEQVQKCRFDNINITARNNGWLTFQAELTYNIRATVDDMGVPIAGTEALHKDDKISVEVYSPNGDKVGEEKIPVTGRKNFVNIKIDKPELWWPLGYGEQPLYKYTIKLIRGGIVTDVIEGRTAFREVSLVEEPKNKDFIGYTIKINGEEIFVKGSNWVPIDCFTGTIQPEKYVRLLNAVKQANINMLRVWGGGIYESDLFYDLCDELGIMVSQDFMFACGDIPESNEKWLSNSLNECEYQMKRLRIHPSVVYWCGGNEKTGAYGLQISKGDYFCDYVLQGLVYTFDKTRPYARQSPCSWTDVGNDMSSGDSHAGSFEGALEKNLFDYRKIMAGKLVPFISECAVLGPNSIETNKKIYPEEKLWPLNEYWEDRLMDNPYASVRLNFLQRQLKYSETFYGKVESLEDFTKKGMLIHSEFLRAEVEYARSRKSLCSGIANWMFSDIWPCGTWSIIDYFGEPKGALYSLSKAYAPILLTFVQDLNGNNNAFIINDTLNELCGNVEYGVKKYSGEVIAKAEKKIVVHSNEKAELENTFECAEDEYYYIKACLNGKTYENIYSENFWKDYIKRGEYKYKVKRLSDKKAEIIFKAVSFVKFVSITHENNYDCKYSDNYFDLQAGEEKTVILESENDIDLKKIVITQF